MAQLGARLDGIEEAVGSNPIGSTNSTTEKALGLNPVGSPTSLTSATMILLRGMVPFPNCYASSSLSQDEDNAIALRSGRLYKMWQTVRGRGGLNLLRG